MKRPADDQSLVETPLSAQKRKSGSESRVKCPPFCEPNCPFMGKHNESIISLVNLKDSDKSSLEKWKDTLKGAEDNFKQLLPLDSVPEMYYPLLHWAAILGKPNAVKWLLQQESISTEDPHDPGRSRLNASNKMVLFSTVRHLHIGMPTTEKDKIRNTFTKILDAVRNHDPMVLSVQELDTGDTVLHLCASGEQDSTAPFFSYLKRIVGKLKEHYDDENAMKILETKNKDGDTFLHRVAKSSKGKEAKEIIDYIVIEKFDGKKLESVLNKEGKTADAILNEPFRADSGVFQTSGQELASASASLSETSDKEDEGHETSSRCSTNDLEHPRAEEEEDDDEEDHVAIDCLLEENRGLNAVPSGISPETPSPFRDEEGEVIGHKSTEGLPGASVQSTTDLRDIPTQIFEMSQSLADPSRGSDANNLFQDLGPEEMSVNTVEYDNGQSASHTDTFNDSQENAIFQKIEVKWHEIKSKLAEAERELQECKTRKEQILEEEKERMAIFQRLQNEFSDFEAKLSALL